MTTTTRKALKIEDLTAKHFIAWIKKQVRLNGRHAVIGFIGDHRDNPLENWLQELTGERYIPVMIEGFESAGVEYALSNTFQWLSMALEGDLDADDLLAEQGWREITAWETLQMVEQLVSPEDYLVAQPVVEQVEEVAASTAPVVEQEVVPMMQTSRKASVQSRKMYFDHAMRHLIIDMDKHGTFAKVASEHGGDTQYRVDIDESDPHNVHATDCSCPDHRISSHYCKHMQIVDLFYKRIVCGSDVDLSFKDAYQKAIDKVLDTAYAIRGQEIAAAGTLNHTRTAVAPRGATSIENNLARMGWMR